MDICRLLKLLTPSCVDTFAGVKWLTVYLRFETGHATVQMAAALQQQKIYVSERCMCWLVLARAGAKV